MNDRAGWDGSGGQIIGPDDPGYDDARGVWNGVIDRRPAAIARCADDDDVLAALRFGREAGLTIAVRGGGHNVAGTGTVEGGLVIDLSPMRGVRVDPAGGVAVVQGGATLHDLDAATQEHGLAAPVGIVSETGVAGLTLSGGMGWHRRRHGLSCDNLVSARVVTAAGEIVDASADEHPDLFWGLRGGGGNFGIVTSFTFRVHPVGPDVAVAFVLYPAERGEDVVAGCEAWTAAAPEEVSPLAFYGRVPPVEAFPAELHGRAFAAVGAVHPVAAEGEDLLRPLRELADPLLDLSDTLPYVAAQSLLDEDYPKGARYYWKSINLRGLGDGALAQLERSAAEAPSGLSTVDVWYQGGAMSRVGAQETAFGDRSSPILIGVEANWEDPADDEVNIAWARGCIADLGPYSAGGTYLNFPGFLEEGEAQLRDAYGANLDRLSRVKATYDPDNVFRVNQNIAPATA
jgi:FAD/FMN-containing dehydrogenase